ncbi:MAG: GNAT superfamily N-acetyltransferase [Litorivivens sp.]|jgi:GNAT superfamily N-acetyltransferase
MQQSSISTDTSLLDIEMIHDYLSNQSYWSKGISLDTLLRAIDNSICFGLYIDRRTIGFTRVVTDKATFAYLCDVFVLAQHQGMGYGKMMIQKAMNHADLKGLRRWCLLTADAHTMYTALGWKEIVRPERWMELHSPTAYQSNIPAP